MTRTLTVLAALLVALTLAACGGDDNATTTASTPSSAETATPALWKLADSDTTIYLLGTFHALPAGTKWRTPAIDKAVGQADRLVVEVDTEDQLEAAAVFERIAVTPDLPPIAERVPNEKRSALEAMIARSGVPTAAFDRYETWAAGFLLVGVILQQTDFGAENGVEAELGGIFRGAGKPIDQLETVEQQLRIFDGLSEADQRDFLVASLDDPTAFERELDELFEIWKRGDDTAIGVKFDEELRQDPELREALLTTRNAAWAVDIAKRLDTPGTVLVAVGAGHLAGPDSVQEILGREGLTVTRL